MGVTKYDSAFACVCVCVCENTLVCERTTYDKLKTQL
jgi:hypothetical protein